MSPAKRGELVYDSLHGRVGAFMDRIGRMVFLRPEHGGAEWDVDGRWLEPAAKSARGGDVGNVTTAS